MTPTTIAQLRESLTPEGLPKKHTVALLQSEAKALLDILEEQARRIQELEQVAQMGEKK